MKFSLDAKSGMNRSRRGSKMKDEMIEGESVWNKYSPIFNPWFESEFSYEGRGKAIFENPIGTIIGNTMISVDELGNLKVTMEYESLETETKIESTSEFFRILKFLHGDSGNPNQVFMPIGSKNRNPCTSITVETDDGVFTSESILYWSTLEIQDRIVFSVQRGTFNANTKKRSKYWVIPLINYVSSFNPNYHHLITKHPLRQYTTPVIPDIENINKKNVALMVANSKNHLVAFYFGKKIGFIEPLHDYKEREQKLKSGQVKHKVTALMVGEVTSATNSRWFPNQYTDFLSFISGTEVGFYWLEFRDSKGKLVSRKHLPSQSGAYEKGYVPINEAIHGGTGNLLSIASNSPEFEKDYFGVLIKHLIRLSLLGRQIEDQMTILIRAFESLCKSLNLHERYLKTYLPGDFEENVETTLIQAKQKIQDLILRAKAENLFEIGSALERIESNLANTNNKDGSFGMKILDVLKRFDLPDHAIMEQYYSQNSRNISWSQTLSKFRNAVIHDGYFQIRNGTHDFNEILAVENHLHDILVRIVLKTLGYEGDYQPTVVEHLTDGKTVNWVSEKTLATELGYGKRIFNDI